MIHPLTKESTYIHIISRKNNDDGSLQGITFNLSLTLLRS